MIKIEKTLLFIIVLVFLVGVASATETPQEDQSYTNDDTVVSDISTVSQDNKETIKFEEKNLMDDNPIKIGESKTQSIEKKTKDTNLKQDGIIEVHNYTELKNAVNNASSTGVDTTIRLLQGSYNNTGTIRWDTGGMVLTIDGNGQTINGHQQKVFQIGSGEGSSASMILKNITIINATGNTAGGAIYNYGTLTVTDSTFTNNTANYNNGGAIRNHYGTLTVSNSTFNNNQAEFGGAIFDLSRDILTNISSCNFINNTGYEGAAIDAYGWVNLTNNTFKENTAKTNNTIFLQGYWNGLFEGNVYESTDIALNEIKLTIKDDQDTFQQDEDIILNYTIQLTNPMYYKDFETGINDITLYINGEKNITTKYENTTIKDLPAGKYEIYYTTCNQQSNTVTFKVMGDSQITTPEVSYEYYAGVNNKIPLIITDPSGEKGTINITVKEDNEYKQLFTYYNIGDGYELPTESLANALKNLYNPLSDSYIINIIYSSDCTNPSSTEFTLNITKQRNTTIVYDILNNTEGNVQINITVQDAIYQTPINDASIQITGDIKQNTTSGILTDNTLTPGDYTINVKYPETEDYKASQTTIDFTVEIDKDKKIAELEEQVENLTEKLEQTNEKIENLTNQLEQANNEIETLNNTIKELTRPPLNTTITLNPIKSSVGSIVNLSANVKDQNGEKVSGGKVIFKVNGITLKDEYNNVLYATLTDGLATLKYKVQAAWMKNTSYVEAVYGGSENYTTSRTKATGILNISKGKAKITLDEKSITAKAGQTITLRAKILDTNGGRVNNDKVVFKINGKTLKDKNGNTLYAKVKDGEAILSYTIPSTYSAKTYTLTAVFGGNYYQRTETNGSIKLEKKAVLITPDSITTKNKKTTIKATITDETGKLLVTSTKLAFKVNGKTLLNNVTSKNGKIDLSFTTTLRPGLYELLIISGENSLYKTGKVTTVLKV
ncbi:hypothetical protein PXD04_11110 (plasmid) [Methanosphaera sp. ISO3-F5]|uniref:coiled-coil domain-containing protein n=1 Tax=Methanosphaera sp. ISO3-F5 TaxID=1452353 RepID=UPI002B264549|nr:hypothetical protein [Methanosphaera sp. ISO3-F5]WQH65423.1 hypothetical protein PXD04_11110 [Methanosphaera sp. ISO3-F5]